MTTTEPNIEVEIPLDPNAITMSINGKSVAGRKGELIIAAADRSGDYIPRFCYHPRMSSVGMCRQCLVEVEGPRGPMMVVSCMTSVGEGQIVRTETDQVKRAQEGIVELLLANHPLDCPVCDKGGECPLQDQAFSHGPGESRFIEEKRHYEKPIPISDLVLLDRERCILCDRCTRFADEVAGDALIQFTSRGNNTQIQTFPDEPFSSYFSGNTVQICPVGALTAQPYRFKARPWDLEKIESTCTTCSVGCRITLESSRDEMLRYQGVDSDPVNHGWLCDKGRFNFEAAKSDQRIENPMVRSDGDLVATSWSVALSSAASLIAQAIKDGGPQSVAILGGARGTNEDAYAWALLAQSLGISNVDAQLDDGLPTSLFGYAQATIDEAANATTVLLLSPDLKEELPILYLRLPKQKGLTRYAWKSASYEPGRQVSVIQQTLTDPAVATQIAQGSVVVVVGRANLAEDDSFTMAALDAVLAIAPQATVLPVVRRGNIRGAVETGLVMGSTNSILQSAIAGEINCLVLVGADPMNDVPDLHLVRQALAAVPKIIAVDTTMSPSLQRCEVVLPAAAFGEKDGTTTNLEGRVTQLNRKVNARGTARPDWMIAVELGELLGHDLGLGSVQEIHSHLARNVESFADVSRAALAVNPDGVLLRRSMAHAHSATATEVPVHSGFGYRLVVSRKLYDNGTNVAQSPSLVGLAPSSALHMHPLDFSSLGVDEGTSIKISNHRTSIVMPVVMDDSVVRGTVWAAWALTGANIGELIDSSRLVNDVKVETL
jgi:NADH-quinone oxidoreductase subunit G